MIRAIPLLGGVRNGSTPVENPPRSTDIPPVEGKIRLSCLTRINVKLAAVDLKRLHDRLNVPTAALHHHTAVNSKNLPSHVGSRWVGG